MRKKVREKKGVQNQNGKRYHFQETRSLGLFRSDYMVHSMESNEIKQVEFNTIASSFAGISSKFRPLHRYINITNNTHNFILFYLPVCHCFVFYFRLRTVNRLFLSPVKVKPNTQIFIIQFYDHFLHINVAFTLSFKSPIFSFPPFDYTA